MKRMKGRGRGALSLADLKLAESSAEEDELGFCLKYTGCGALMLGEVLAEKTLSSFSLVKC